MGVRDRFFTATTAKAILSWRILLGAAAGVLAGVLGVPWFGAAAIAAVVYVGGVMLAMPKPARPPKMDPFALSEPWRQFVQGAQRSQRQLTATVQTARAGPLRDRLQGIADRLDLAIAESWQIARRGDEIDTAVRGLDPTRLRSRLETLRSRSASAPSDDLAAAVASVESQLASADRMKELSASTADRLRLTQARLDELVSRAAEVSIGAGDTKEFAHDVDDLVLELEGLRLAVQELPQ
jgi:hypothetical protein